MNESCIRRAIREYVKKCGNRIEMDILVKDLQEAFSSELSFHGRNIIDFLRSITGLVIKKVDDKLFVESVNQSATCKSDLEGLSKLCIRMQNNLLLDGRSVKRYVTVNSESPMKIRKNAAARNYSSSSCQSEENEGDKSFSGEFVHSLHSNSSEYLAGTDYFLNNFESSVNESFTSTSPISNTCSVSTHDMYRFNDYSSFLYESSAIISDVNAFPLDANTFIRESNLLIPESHVFSIEYDVFFPQHDTFDSFSISKLPSVFEETIQDCNTENVSSANWVLKNACLDSYALVNKSAEISDAKIIERLLKLINFQNQSNGLNRFTIEVKYTETYFGSLPNNWLHLLEETSQVFIENLPSGIIIYPNRWFPTNPTRSALPAIKYPLTDIWNVYISSFESTSCIWFRLLEDEYDLKNDILHHEMNKHYRNRSDILNTTNMRFVVRGNLYAVCIEDEWMRCEVIDIEDDIASCFLLDIGVTKYFNIVHLFRLNENFTNTPAMAIQSSLMGLEKYDTCNYINCKVRNFILNKKLKLKPCIETYEKVIPARFFVLNSLNSVEVNQVMLQVIDNELRLPKLDVNSAFDVTILAIEENNCRVQIMSPSFKLLSESLQKAKKIIETFGNSHFKVTSMLKLELNKMYLAKFADDSWQRILVKKLFAECFVSALFIDFGFIKMVRLKDIVECTDFPDTILFIPPQVVQLKFLKMDILVLKYLNELQKPNLFSIKILNREELLVQFFFKLPNGERRPVAHLLHNFSHGYSS